MIWGLLRAVRVMACIYVYISPKQYQVVGGRVGYAKARAKWLQRLHARCSSACTPLASLPFIALGPTCEVTMIAFRAINAQDKTFRGGVAARAAALAQHLQASDMAPWHQALPLPGWGPAG